MHPGVLEKSVVAEIRTDGQRTDLIRDLFVPFKLRNRKKHYFGILYRALSTIHATICLVDLLKFMYSRRLLQADDEE